jgi:hypothetical protein
MNYREIRIFEADNGFLLEVTEDLHMTKIMFIDAESLLFRLAGMFNAEISLKGKE